MPRRTACAQADAGALSACAPSLRGAAKHPPAAGDGVGDAGAVAGQEAGVAHDAALAAAAGGLAESHRRAGQPAPPAAVHVGICRGAHAVAQHLPARARQAALPRRADGCSSRGAAGCGAGRAAGAAVCGVAVQQRRRPPAQRGGRVGAAAGRSKLPLRSQAGGRGAGGSGSVPRRAAPARCCLTHRRERGVEVGGVAGGVHRHADQGGDIVHGAAVARGGRGREGEEVGKRARAAGSAARSAPSRVQV